ncbi:hypothetical protein E4U59_004405 [Claviceps monticola]|nr:hypothetical protein E4U59_004405 [Claviceps monticola]
MAAAIEVTNAIDEVEGISETDSSIDIDYSRGGMFKAWQQLGLGWEKPLGSIKKMRILQYTTREYMPWRYQWAKCFIGHYRNFGQSVNSLVESAHKQLKSFLVGGRGHLFHLHESIEQMLEE